MIIYINIYISIIIFFKPKYLSLKNIDFSNPTPAENGLFFYFIFPFSFFEVCDQAVAGIAVPAAICGSALWLVVLSSAAHVWLVKSMCKPSLAETCLGLNIPGPSQDSCLPKSFAIAGIILIRIPRFCAITG